ncbi:hypothetical protein [Pelagibacterium luteolum]|uniref:Uncharacterized protein n=1 Tax=Pelagibacterium luteolum TaxID=440168 RepID=A0A1G7V1P9_9HYPH|nr:hypothetical protein [Pelagibacterium luteolum]SDG53647.1 hypothetical protein SAMN04487974_103423 [Pelagibacterium luteolum]
MADTEKPNWGNRIILLIFGVLAVVTIAGTIYSTTLEWEAGDMAETPVEAPAETAPQ